MDRKARIPSGFKAAAIQFNPSLGDTSLNRERMACLLREAAANGARLVVFPEMSSSGYVWKNREEIAPYVETIPGPTTEALCSVTREYGCYAVAGLPEVDPSTGAYYNSTVLIGPEGVVGSYRKTHLFAADPRWAREGNDGFPVFSTPIGNIAMLICMDAMYFEPARIAALEEADVIAFPTNWVGSGNGGPSKTWCLRAKENGLCWIAANRSDTERGARFTGGSAIIDADGSVQESLISGEGIVYGTVRADPDKRKGILRGRRPEAYQEILLHPYLWKEGETRPIGEPSPFEVVVLPLDMNGDGSGTLDQLRQSLESVQPRLMTSNRLYVLPEIGTAALGALGTDRAEKLLHELQLLAGLFRGYIALSVLASDSGECAMYLVGPEGVVGAYKQVHHKLHRECTGFRTFEVPFGRVGLLTGRDADYPEAYRVLAKQGADIIAVSGSGQHDSEIWMKRIWAFENDAILACAVPAGSSGSMLFLHRQVALEGIEPPEPYVQAFQPEMMAVAGSRPFLRRMKTHLYDRLVMAEPQSLKG
ncbi:nitrilase-related carbon-nitrogen hydrolase [Paenibacillus naphthalenovorans]|uniref:nitrilase-related carbon-nitrogen hydrolase n=1 Tax=Paenibacillus naphthalenovorans TaxID=162209 RepID=UPI00088735C2|nr:nitrilase-related carbon-nitrogen hydrolase [Paenibacillus naphthalenovorans]SDJ72169.1 Predicted amidohydrolase [Paenibacillus naphthalenovorans]